MLEVIAKPTQPSQEVDSKEYYHQPEKFPGQKEMEKFSIEITRAALIKNLTKEDGSIPKNIDKYEEILAVERAERLQNLWHLDLIFRNYEGMTFPSVLNNEVGIAVGHVEEFKNDSKSQIEDIWLNYLPPNFYSKEEYLKTANFNEKEAGLFKNSIVRKVYEVAYEFEVDLPGVEILDKYAEYIAQRHNPDLDEYTKNQNYIEDYPLLNFLNGSNNEITIARQNLEKAHNPLSADENDSLLVAPKKQPESVIKTSISSKNKENRGSKIEDNDDNFRSSVKVDQLFEKIDYNAFLEKFGSKKEFVAGIKSEQNWILSKYVYAKQKEIEKQGYKVRVEIKCYPSGYSDITIKVFKIGTNGKEQKYEEQIQTEKTLLNKEKETPENDVRKNILMGIRSSNLEFLEASFNEFPEEDRKSEIQKTIGNMFGKMLREESLRSGVVTEQEKRERLEIVTKIVKDKILEINPGFRPTNPQDYANLAQSLLDNFKAMTASLARSQAWFASGATIENKDDVDEMLRNIEKLAREEAENKILENLNKQELLRVAREFFLKERNNVVKIKREVATTMAKYKSKAKSAIELPAQNPFGEDFKQRQRTYFFHPLQSDKILLLQKDLINSKAHGTLEMPGGVITDDDLAVTIADDEPIRKSTVRNLRRETGWKGGLQNDQEDPLLKDIKILGSTRYVNPTSHQPTILNRTSVDPTQQVLKDRAFSLKFGTNPQDKHNPQFAKWVSVEDFIAAQITGFIDINRIEYQLSGNARLSREDIWELHAKAKSREGLIEERRKSYRQRLEVLKMS